MAITRAEFEELKDAVAVLRADRVEMVKLALDAMTEGERLEVFGCFCKHCGADDPTCRCWDDS